MNMNLYITGVLRRNINDSSLSFSCFILLVAPLLTRYTVHEEKPKTEFKMKRKQVSWPFTYKFVYMSCEHRSKIILTLGFRIDDLRGGNKKIM